jgi:hypothetical protein
MEYDGIHASFAGTRSRKLLWAVDVCISEVDKAGHKFGQENLAVNRYELSSPGALNIQLRLADREERTFALKPRAPDVIHPRVIVNHNRPD